MKTDKQPKKVLSEEQRRKRLEYHKKYEAAHKEQVKAWHKAYNQRKAEAKLKKLEEKKWIQERIDAGRQAVNSIKSKGKK